MRNTDSNTEQSTMPSQAAERKRKDLTNAERTAVLQELLARSTHGELQRGALSEVAVSFGVHTRTIARLWARAQASKQDGKPMDVSTRKQNSGRKKRNNSEAIERLRTSPHDQRGTLRAASEVSGVSHMRVWRMVQSGELRPHSNATKPLLDERVRAERLAFCKSFVNMSSLHFHDMYDCVHLDEKWFYLTASNRRYYLTADEEPPLRVARSKRFITKVMFLVAVARPRFDRTKGEWFDGKVGLWPLITHEAAERSSRNRPKGAIVTKPIASVDSTVYRTFLIDKVLPAIVACWPAESRAATVFLQQDNARPHIAGNDPAFVAAVATSGLDIRLRNQPPNSPDLNVLDLGFFTAIQSLQQRIQQRNIDDLIRAVEQAFGATTRRTLNNVFLSLQNVMDEIIANNGGNNFQLRHMSKERLEREGRLPVSIAVSDAVAAALAFENGSFVT